MNRNRWTLLGIAALFGLPLLAAWLMQTGWVDWRPAETVNLGRLVEPPLPLATPALADGRHWLMLYRLPAECARECLDAVTGLRQVHKAAGRHRENVAVALLSATAITPELGARLEAIDPGLRLLEDAAAMARSDAALPRANPDGGDGAAFVLDPGGNVILAYQPGFDPNHVHRDLKRLLTWSDQD